MLTDKVVDFAYNDFYHRISSMNERMSCGENMSADDIYDLSDSVDVIVEYAKNMDPSDSNREMYSHMAEHVESDFRKLCEDYVKSTDSIINESRIGFSNPFANMDKPAGDIQVKVAPEEGKSDDGYEIVSMKAWASRPNGPIFYKKGRMYSNTYYLKGDVIECCPVKVVGGDALYTNAIRDNAFIIDTNRDMYGVPGGYAVNYRNEAECDEEPNAKLRIRVSSDGNDDYQIDVIAIKKIFPNDEIILESGEKLFGNTYDSNVAYEYPTEIKTFKLG